MGLFQVGFSSSTAFSNAFYIAVWRSYVVAHEETIMGTQHTIPDSRVTYYLLSVLYSTTNVEVMLMNKLDSAIVLITNAKELVETADRNEEINWTGYQDNLRIARRLLSEMYVDKGSYDAYKYDREEKIAKQLRGDNDE